MLIAPVEDMECDSLCVLGIHIVARCGKGAATFFFTYVDGMEDLEEDSCIEHSAEEMPEEGDLYLMKSGIIAGSNLEDAVLCIRASPAIEESGNVELLLLRRREL